MRRYTRTAFETILIDTKTWKSKNLNFWQKFLYTGHLISFFTFISIPFYLILPIVSFYTGDCAYHYDHEFLIFWLSFLIPLFLALFLISKGYNKTKSDGVMLMHTISNVLGILDYIKKQTNWKVASKKNENNNFTSAKLVLPCIIIFILNIIVVITFIFKWQNFIDNTVAVVSVCWIIYNLNYMYPTIYAVIRDIKEDIKNIIETRLKFTVLKVIEEYNNNKIIAFNRLKTLNDQN